MAALTRRRLLLLLLIRRRRRARRNALNSLRKGRTLVRELFSNRKRLGEYHNAVQEMQATDLELFFKQFRMTPARFDHLLSLISLVLLRDYV